MITALTPPCATTRGLPSNSLLQWACATGVLGRWGARASPARGLDDGRDPPGWEGTGGLGPSEGNHRPGREARGDRASRGGRGDRRGGAPRREARRHPLRLHLGRRAGLQGGQLLPAAVLAREARRPASRDGARGGRDALAASGERAATARIQGRAGDGGKSTRFFARCGTMIPRARWQETITRCT